MLEDGDCGTAKLEDQFRSGTDVENVGVAETFALKLLEVVTEVSIE